MAETVMMIDGKAYKEAPPLVSCDCKGCVLYLTAQKLCTKALDGAAKAAFGGDCVDRGVIYEEVKDE